MARYRLDGAGIQRWQLDAHIKSIRVARYAIKKLAHKIIDDAPVDTGFMVASAKVRLNPRSTWKPRPHPKTYGKEFYEADTAQEDKKSKVNAVVAQMQHKDRFGLTFVADYTEYVHEGLGQPAQPFVSSNVVFFWPKFLREAVAKYKRSK